MQTIDYLRHVLGNNKEAGVEVAAKLIADFEITDLEAANIIILARLKKNELLLQVLSSLKPRQVQK